MIAASTLPADVNPPVVISQVYFNFVEIFNRSAQTVSLEGWSIQYSYGNYENDPGAIWNAIPIKGQLAPGQYYLIEVDGGNSLQPDVSGFFPIRVVYGSSGLNFEGTLALIRTAQPLATGWPSVLDVVDLFGYGIGETADGTPFPSLQKAAVRTANGCLETHNNLTDFQFATPAPRNSTTPFAPCSAIPVIQANGIVNAASFTSGPIAPGELVAVFGADLGPASGAAGQLTTDHTHFTTSVAGVQVYFDGVPAPVLYASAGQVNVVAPFDIAGKSKTSVRVQVNGVPSAPLVMSVVPTAPGIFTALGTGTGQAAALNQDNTANGMYATSPQSGVIVLYATGAGQTQPAGEDGKLTMDSPPRPAASVSVTIGGQNADILYAGNAPALVHGVLQVNARIPPGLSGRQPVVLTVGGVQSQADVNIAVELPLPVPGEYFPIDISATDIAYDPGTNRLYASVGASATAHANSIAIIDPPSGNILDWIPSATGPGLLAISDDGHYLYTALKANAWFDSIQRIDLRTKQQDFVLSLKDIYQGQLNLEPNITDIQVLPGQPRSIAVAATGAPVAIIDDKVRRPSLGPEVETLTAGPPGILLADKRQLFVNAGGVLAGPFYPRNLDVSAVRVQPAGSRLITSTGLVMSGTGDDLLAQYRIPDPSGRSFAYHPGTRLVYYAGAAPGSTNIKIEAYDLNTFMPLGVFLAYDYRVDVAKQFYGVPARLVPLGAAGLATISTGYGTTRIFVFPLSVLQAVTPMQVPAAQPSTHGIRRFSIPTNSMAANTTGDQLYFSIPPVAPNIGNSVVSFDVAAGAFGNPVWVGSEPDALAVSTDGQYVHVALDGARAITRLKLPGLSRDKQFHIALDDGRLADAGSILSLPSNPKSIVVNRMMAFLRHTYGFAIYDDGVPRPDVTTLYESLRKTPLVNEAQLSADGGTLYGEEGEIEGARFSRWNVTPKGLEFDDVGTTFGYQVYLDLKCQYNRCLTGCGYLADTNSLQLLGQLAPYDNSGLAAMDLDNNRLFLLSYSGADANVESYDATTYKVTGRYTISQWGYAHSFAKVSGDQLVIANGSEVILLPISMLKPPR